MTPQELESNLSQFIGTENYTRWSPLFRNFVLTDGALYLAENARAFWLMDVIASHVKSYRNEDFVVVVFERSLEYAYEGEGGWTLNLVDDIPSNKVFATQEIEYSFPLDEIKLYIGRTSDYFVIMLPSEH